MQICLPLTFIYRNISTFLESYGGSPSHTPGSNSLYRFQLLGEKHEAIMIIAFIYKSEFEPIIV